MKLFPYRDDPVAGPNHPFPAEFDADPLIFYHGTSSSYESAIESEGLLPGKSLFDVKDLVAIVKLFSDMGWDGINTGSLGILKPFSVDHDFAQVGGKPLFLAESARRAAAYASLDYAGGEIARSVRNCFDDLSGYLDDSSVRDDHMRDVQASVDFCRRNGASPHPVPDITLDAIRERLISLDGVRSVAFKAEADHAHGVVYAIKLTASGLAKAKMSGSMGLMCFEHIGLNQIAGKTVLPNGFAFDYTLSRPAMYVVERLGQWKAILADEKERSRANPL